MLLNLRFINFFSIFALALYRFYFLLAQFALTFYRLTDWN